MPCSSGMCHLNQQNLVHTNRNQNVFSTVPTFEAVTVPLEYVYENGTFIPNQQPLANIENVDFQIPEEVEEVAPVVEEPEVEQPEPQFLYITNRDKTQYVNINESGELRFSQRPQGWLMFQESVDSDVVILKSPNSDNFLGSNTSDPAFIRILYDKDDLVRLALLTKDEEIYLSDSLMFTRDEFPGQFQFDICLENCDYKHLEAVNMYLENEVRLCRTNGSTSSAKRVNPPNRSQQKQCIII